LFPGFDVKYSAKNHCQNKSVTLRFGIYDNAWNYNPAVKIMKWLSRGSKNFFSRIDPVKPVADSYLTTYC